MKRTFMNLLLVALSLQVFAQIPNLDTKIPFDPETSKGVMENGLTYYVKANATPKNRAELLLVVQAGSIDEDDDQRGLAHFCEHMSFNGTKNFPKHELIKYFESIGMEFGPEINAYTSFDETVYMLKVPLDKTEYMDKGIQVLYDWACQVTDSDEEINAERGIIHEEWRGGRGANERMLNKWLPAFLHESKYAERLPIGTMEVVDHCKPEVLRRFRNDWYRPDLQAVVVVGDFDQDAMVKKVIEKFSNIKPVENPRQKETFDIPKHKETLVKVVTDPEASYSMANVYIKHDMKVDETLNGYRSMMVNNIYNQMMNDRLQELLQSENPPYIYGSAGYGSLIGPSDVFTSMAVAHSGQIPAGLTTVLIENERVKKYGFTASELARTKTAMLRGMEQAYSERDKRKSIDIANEFKRNFLMRKEAVPGIETEYQYYQELMPTITLNEVNALATKWITDENRVVVVTAPEKEGVAIPTEDEIRALLDKVKTMDVTPYEDEVTDQPLMATVPEAGKVVAEKNIELVDAKEWTLSNGSKVILKHTDFKDDQILFNAFSTGGSSLYDAKDDISASYASTIMAMSGIADFKLTMLEKMLADKVVAVSPYISQLSQGFNGSSSVKDVETMLQLVNLYINTPRFDKASYGSFMSRMASQLDNRSASPEAAFSDTFKVVTSNYHPRVRPLTKEVLAEANFERIEAIAKERFSNPGNLTYVFVGNFDEAKLKPLIETYLASLPASEKNEAWVDLGIRAPKGAIEKVVRKGTEPKSKQYIQFHGPLKKFSLQEVTEVSALGKILTTRLLESIREDKASVYSIGAYPGFAKNPVPEYTMTIAYGTSPQKVEELKAAIFATLEDLIKNGPSDDEVAKAREKILREREVSVRENKYWLSTLKQYYMNYDGDFSRYATFDKAVDGLSAKSLKKAAKKIWDFDNYVCVTLFPEEGYENEASAK